jgi:hypothetical protein
MDKEIIIKEIVEGITTFKIIPFLGAGMSKPCKALDWTEIITELKKELKTSTENYLSVAQEYEDTFGREKLITRLKEMCKLEIVDSVSLDNHMKILAMNPPIIYTTNYDNAIEEAAKQILRDYKKIVCLKDIVDSKHGERQIIKFHGDFNDVDSIVFTRNDYDRRLKADENSLDILFRSHILGKSVLFLGYGFGDENIDYIFKKHIELYGADNLPKSYIISFEHDEVKESQLKEKNIVTLVLESVEELSSLINQFSLQVFSQSIDAQFEDMFKPLPGILLTRFELENLKIYLESPEYSDDNKHDKIRETLEGKTIPQDIEETLHQLFERVINEDFNIKIKEAILISFQHTNFRRTEYIFKLCIEFMRLTEQPEFILDFENNNWGSDVLMVIEHKLSNTLNDSFECRKWGCLIILAYLEGMMAENKNLSFKQVDRLLDGLKNYGYDEFGDLGVGFDTDNINRIIEHYLSKHNSTLRARFESKSVLGKRRQTTLEIMNEMMKSLPKNLNK